MDVTIIGAGNVAYHLALAIEGNPKHRLIQIFNRTARRFDAFPDLLREKQVTDWREINLNATIYLIAVSDGAIEAVGQKLEEIGVMGIIAHTSGATSKGALKSHLQYGVFYPLQSFSLSKKVDWQSVPICVDGNSETVQNQLYALAKDFSLVCHLIDDRQRQALHVAAVFVNNFTNHLMTLGAVICRDFDVPFEVLQPLIRETFEKVQFIPSMKAQTGPAIRGDRATLDKHLTLLQNHPDRQLLYRLISESIVKVQEDEEQGVENREGDNLKSSK